MIPIEQPGFHGKYPRVFLRGSFAKTEQVKTTKEKQLTKKSCQTKLKNSCLQNTTFAGCYHLDLLKMVGKKCKNQFLYCWFSDSPW